MASMSAASSKSSQAAKAKAREYAKTWYLKNREKVLEARRTYYAKNKAKVGKRAAAYKEANREKVQESQKRYRDKTKEKQRAYLEKYRKDHAERIKIKVKEYQSKPEAKKKRRHRLKWRYDTDANYRAALAARRIARRAVKAGSIKESTQAIIGCTIAELKAHIEAKWKPGMTWNNNTNFGWHIDHIVPLSKFDFKCPLQSALACHFTNLQPLWAADNMRKGDVL